MCIRIDGPWLKDEHGRTLILRGVNLGGSSKVPREPDGATYRREGFFAHREVSFVGRPFPLEEADEHFARLRAWGLTFLRLVVTWEAVEHAGPGCYDEAYLDYLAEVVRKAGEHGLQLFVDPHQDVWSRFSGGDGAPGWTFEAAGLDITRFQATGAAIVHATHGDPFPQMIWPTNGWKLAAATMFTLFFGGDDFAPTTLVDGEPIQGYLQRHYIGAMRQVAARLRQFPHVVGYDVMNEPMPGYIGNRELHRPAGPLAQRERPSPFQAMLLGAGIPQQIDLWGSALFPRRVGARVVNAGGASAWRPGRGCLWRENGVWDLDAHGRARLLRPHHFAYVRGRLVEFGRDYWRPFCGRFAAAIRELHPGALVFVEPEFGGLGPAWGPEDAPEIVYAPHWYDLVTLYTKRYLPGVALDLTRQGPVLGLGPVRRHFAGELRSHRRHGAERMGAPTIIGEFGIPFDMHGKRAFRTGDFSLPERAMARSFQAIEDALASATLWNYTADNSNARGDQWNDEDLSIYSRDQRLDPADPGAGGRALRAAVRPYARATAGEPLHMAFDVRSRRFVYRFRHDPAATEPTEIFLPRLQYPLGCRVSVSDGVYELDMGAQRLVYRHSAAHAEHEVRVAPA
ncbi:MAG: glycoside hydrolase family 5 protein [Chloroflexales bacterium]|nr:glycoside hydrolase family 5 protein [Chloroflexales bacterium]